MNFNLKNVFSLLVVFVYLFLATGTDDSSSEGIKIFENFENQYSVINDIYNHPDKREFAYFHDFKDEYGKQYFNSWDYRLQENKNQIPMFTVLIDDVLASEIRKYSSNHYGAYSDEFSESNIFKVLFDCVNENGLYQANIFIEEVPNQKFKDSQSMRNLVTANVTCDCSGISENNLSYTSFNGEKRIYESGLYYFNQVEKRNVGNGSTELSLKEEWEQDSPEDLEKNVYSYQTIDKGISNKEVESKNIEDEEYSYDDKLEIDDSKSISYIKINDPDGYTNVRSGKSSSTEIISQIYDENKLFELIDDSGNWWKILIDSEDDETKLGYIYYTKVLKIESYTVAVEKAYFHLQANKDYQNRAYVIKGDNLLCHSNIENSFRNCTYVNSKGDTTIGYVIADQLK